MDRLREHPSGKPDLAFVCRKPNERTDNCILASYTQTVSASHLLLLHPAPGAEWQIQLRAEAETCQTTLMPTASLKLPDFTKVKAAVQRISANVVGTCREL